MENVNPYVVKNMIQSDVLADELNTYCDTVKGAGNPLLEVMVAWALLLNTARVYQDTNFSSLVQGLLPRLPEDNYGSFCITLLLHY